MSGVTGNIVLTGFMGTGKSTVGRILARRRGLAFVDTDAVIESRHGPISQIFADHGEAVFRAIEAEVAAEVAGRTGQVVATGGRMLLDADNEAAFRAGGVVVCLVASVPAIVARVSADGGPVRPLVAGAEDPTDAVERLLAERAEAYARFIQVDTEGKAPDEVADAIEAVVDAISTTNDMSDEIPSRRTT